MDKHYIWLHCPIYANRPLAPYTLGSAYLNPMQITIYLFSIKLGQWMKPCVTIITIDTRHSLQCTGLTVAESFSFYRTRVRSLFTLITNSLTNSLTDSCLVNLIDVTLACEDVNSKFVDVETVADQDRIGNNLLYILKLRFGQKAKLLFRL